MGRRRTPVNLDGVFRRAAKALETGREELSALLAAAEAQSAEIAQRLRELESEFAACSSEAEALEARHAQRRAECLAIVADAGSPPERRQNAVRELELLTLELGVARERAQSLTARRGRLEQAAARSAALAEQVGAMVARLRAATDYLTENVERFNHELEDLRQRHRLGERVIQAQEEERRRVAREIHDGPAQAMANVVLRTEICERLLASNRPEIQQELAQVKRLVKECLREVRTIIFNLRPMALDDLGLVPTLRRYLGNLLEEQVPVELSVQGAERRLPSVVEVAAFRMVQEGVNNARKYARATRIQVQLTFEEASLTVTVSDDGVGFAPESVAHNERREHIGLISMRERIQLLDGEFSVDSAPGRGCRLQARIPIRDAQAHLEPGAAPS